MSNYKNLKTAIDANIKQNGNQEITGPILNSVLNQMVNILGTGYQFAGVATLDPATDPGTPDAKVFYIANGKGTYTNFGGLEVTEDEVVVLYWDTAWHKVSTGIASQAKLSELEKEVATKQDIIPDLDTIRAGAALGASALQEETDPSVPSWAKEATKPSYTPEEIGAASEESLQIHENDNTRHITASERAKWDAKQDALTLTIKDNGNIVLANIQGQSKEFMPATPSGDPMHYAYLAAGAVYNDTGEDIVKIGEFTGEEIIHKSGHWYYNELGDISNKQMADIFVVGNRLVSGRAVSMAYAFQNIRTNLFTDKGNPGSWVTIDLYSFLISFSGETIRLCEGGVNSDRIYTGRMDHAFYGATNLKKILGNIYLNSKNIDYTDMFDRCYKLEYVRLNRVSQNLVLRHSSYLQESSILYMINNETATSAITITLHADAYARAMANADIVAALEAHPNVSLASA